MVITPTARRQHAETWLSSADVKSHTALTFTLRSNLCRRVKPCPQACQEP